jgi:hypothetical protein
MNGGPWAFRRAIPCDASSSGSEKNALTSLPMQCGGNPITTPPEPTVRSPTSGLNRDGGGPTTEGGGKEFLLVEVAACGASVAGIVESRAASLVLLGVLGGR